MENKLNVTLENAKRLHAIVSELKELALSLFGEKELKQSKFKNGDYIYAELDSVKPVFGIYNESLSKGSECGMTCSFQQRVVIKPYVCHNDYPIDIFSIATEEQKSELDNRLAKVGKRYNPKTDQLEDIIKVGDLVIAWNNDLAKYAIIGTIELYSYGLPLIGYNRYTNVIKWDSTKVQYEQILKGE